MNNILDQLIQGCWVNPDTDKTEHFPIEYVGIEPNLIEKSCTLLPSLELGKKLAIVCDLNTYDLLGKDIESELIAAGFEIQILKIDEHRPEANDLHVETIRNNTKTADALIAVGSGTINDLCKYASFQDGKPYIVFGTAPSMNGYSSANAAITVKGHKKSLQAHLPKAIFLDLDILANAPNRLIRSGLGDALCRTTCQADWLLSKRLRNTPYLTAPFALLAEDEPYLLEQSEALMHGNKEAMLHLARTLILSGFGMTMAGGSYPASQAEHLISHTMEMVYKKKAAYSATRWPLHGEQIGVTTLTMSRLQHQLLKKRPTIHADTINEEAILAFFGKETGEECIREFRQKALSPRDAEKINDELSMYWLSTRAKLLEVMLPTETLEKALLAAGAATAPDQFDWNRSHYNAALIYAPFMRDRFTFLDLARLR